MVPESGGPEEALSKVPNMQTWNQMQLPSPAVSQLDTILWDICFDVISSYTPKPAELKTTDYEDQCFAQPSSEKFPPSADGNNYGDPEPDIMQRIQDLETLNLKKDFSNTFSQGSGDIKEEEAERA
ncbi:hypothetical protein STEG23_011559 [Scotinomys teguina]